MGLGLLVELITSTVTAAVAKVLGPDLAAIRASLAELVELERARADLALTPFGIRNGVSRNMDTPDLAVVAR
jgi:hypothetical protein